MQAVKKTGPTNIILRKTIRKLRSIARKNSAPIWHYVAELLERPTRRRIVVNISKINRYTEAGDTVVVPGKVLGSGSLDHQVIVAATGFSKTAVDKITKNGGKVMHVLDLAEKNPKGSRIKIIV